MSFYFPIFCHQKAITKIYIPIEFPHHLIMIRIFLGKPGSGKTISAVREMMLSDGSRKTYTNIKTKGVPGVVHIKADMIIKKDIKDMKRRRDGSEYPVYEFKLNKEFWQNADKPINVVLDEVHTLLNSRRAMSSVNVIMGDFLAMVRRVLGDSDSGYGELTLITQRLMKIDPDGRELANHIRYHIGHYFKRCKDCNTRWAEHTEFPEEIRTCPRCGSRSLKKYGHSVQVLHFSGEKTFMAWRYEGKDTYHREYYITNLDRYFGRYDTLQWENIISELYT